MSNFSQITPSPIDATAATQLVGVQDSTTDNLFTPQNINSAPFLSTVSIGITGATARSSAKRASDVVNVLDFGAVGDGSHDDTAAIQAAITAASALGTSGFHGGTVFFPTPSVYYKVTAALSNNLTQSTVYLRGTGKEACRIIGSVNGFIVDTNDGSSGGPTTAGDIAGIDSLHIRNTFLSAGYVSTVGAVRMNGIQDAYIKDSTINGWNGLVAFSNIFRLLCSNVRFTPPSFAGTFGMIGVQGAGCFVSCDFSSGWWVGAMSPGGTAGTTQGPYFFGCRFEVCVIGIWLGTGISGANNAPCDSWIIAGLQTEQCLTGVLIGNAQYGQMSGVFLSNQTGFIFPIQASAGGSIVGNGATVTVTTPSYYTLDNFGWTSGTRGLFISDPGGSYSEGAIGSWLTATRTSPTTFTYASTKVGAAGLSPNFFIKMQYNLRHFTGTGNSFVSNMLTSTAANTEFAGIDLYGVTGTYVQKNNTIIGHLSPAGWIMPHANNKASWTYIQSDQPRGSTTDNAGRTAGMLFANLPGQASVLMATALEGMEYNITNCNSVTWGDTATGGGTTHALIRYNGTKWSVVGI